MRRSRRSRAGPANEALTRLAGRRRHQRLLGGDRGRRQGLPCAGAGPHGGPFGHAGRGGGRPGQRPSDARLARRRVEGRLRDGSGSPLRDYRAHGYVPAASGCGGPGTVSMGAHHRRRRGGGCGVRRDRAPGTAPASGTTRRGGGAAAPQHRTAPPASSASRAAPAAPSAAGARSSRRGRRACGRGTKMTCTRRACRAAEAGLSAGRVVRMPLVEIAELDLDVHQAGLMIALISGLGCGPGRAPGIGDPGLAGGVRQCHRSDESRVQATCSAATAAVAYTDSASAPGKRFLHGRRGEEYHASRGELLDLQNRR